ncbi:MAG TPA: hypothetical protein DIT07_08560, partial [Sphingobacteriaceae bacterium]|nr:hypothetical protein [Sphingobacteriaceae bacterium]
SLSNDQAVLTGNRSISFWSYSFSTSHSMKLNSKLSLEYSSYYNSKSQNLYSKYDEIFDFSAGVKRSAILNNIDFSFNITDLFGTNRFGASSIYDTQTTRLKSQKNNRRLNVFIKYNFNTGTSFSRSQGSSKGDFGDKRF